MADDLFRQFQTYWKAGAGARLYLECHAGEVWMNLQIHLYRPPPPPTVQGRQHGSPPDPHPPHQQRSRQSPSRLRRRAKRAQARAAANAAVNKVTEDVAVQTEDDLFKNYSDANISDDVPLHHHHPPLAAVDAIVQHQHQAVVHDVFCPDSDFNLLPAAQAVVPLPTHLTIIPQLDGQGLDTTQDETVEEEEWINPNPATGLWTCRCCHYAHNFTSEEDLKNHHDTLSIEYDECNICYPWHVWS